ncbi:MAG: hypothetical protein J0M12_01130 [Deltaproteobacteria bacterium]|nr:hypothetical protein [Deltaproteobacteria bacterium]
MTPTPSRQSYSSLALRSVEERLVSDKSMQVFDLGRASGANIEFYSKFARNIYVEDLLWTVVQERESQPVKAEGLFKRLTSVPEQARFDLICCWDVLNYLAPAELLEVGQFLKHFSHEKTLLFMLTHNRAVMPDTPSVYKIQKDTCIIYEVSSDGTVPSPGYSKRQLDQLLPGFKRTRSVLLRSGMEEQLYSLR